MKQLYSNSPKAYGADAVPSLHNLGTIEAGTILMSSKGVAFEVQFDVDVTRVKNTTPFFVSPGSCALEHYKKFTFVEVRFPTQYEFLSYNKRRGV